MRILLITQWFDPEPHFKGLLFAKELVKQGHEVQVLTGFPNYPGGKLYPGYRVQVLQREVIDGVSIIRVPLYPSHDRSGFRRMLNYVSFAVSAATIGASQVDRADVAYVYHPPATVGLPALVLRLLLRIPFVYDIQDMWPDTLGVTGMLGNPFVLRIISWWCRLVYRVADRIVVLSPGFKRLLVERGVPEQKIDVVYNWCDETQAKTAVRDEQVAKDLGMSGLFNIVFAGTMGKAQALDAVLDAARLVAAEAPAIQFIFVGGGIEVDHLKQRANEMQLPNVRFLPRRPVSEIGPVLALADALLVHLKDDPLFSITIPSKTQAYLSVGKPVMMGVRGDAADLVLKAGAGVTCEPEDPESIAAAALRLYGLPRTELEQMGMNGRTFYQQELAVEVGARRFGEILRAVAGRK